MSSNKNKIHVVQIIPTLGFGGAERLVVDLSNQLVVDNFDCSIITYFDNTPLASQLDKRVKLILVKKKHKLSFGLVKDLANTLQNIGADVVHTHLFGADFWASKAAKKLNLPVLSTEHSVYKNESFVKNKLKYWNKKNVDKFVAVSKNICEELKNKFGIKKAKISTINPGIDLAKFLSVTSKKTIGPIKFLLMGRLEKEKNIAMALEALAQYRDRDWQCRIVGNGSLKSELQSLVRRLNLVDKVVFVEATSNVVGEYGNCDVVLVPSLYEGFALVALEAMACARTVFATRVGVLPELIIDKENGLLCPDITTASFANGLAWIFENSDKLLSLGKKARSVVEKNFSLGIMTDKYEEIYLSLCTKK